MPEIKKLVLITGSSSGIGAGIVDAFLEDQSWIVLGVSRSSRPLDNPRYHELIVDLTSEKALSEVKAALESQKAKNELGEICFVHNFGLTDHRSVLEVDRASWDRVFYTNVTLPMLITRELSPLMPSGSSHQYIGSTLSTMAVPNAAAYISSKHALLGLMRASAQDLSLKGIRTNLICPGFTESAMAREVVGHAAQRKDLAAEKHQAFLESLSPLGRFLRPKEIGDLVLFLASTPTISGEIIQINGGFGLKSH
ncbi:MAG: SDR family oxidoreductase [Candidatus Caenarcaniphilales bacterium]|nr:SDR family oxidoreductase [Candidatus Caenarcaniphilales bacterium]